MHACIAGNTGSVPLCSVRGEFCSWRCARSIVFLSGMQLTPLDLPGVLLVLQNAKRATATENFCRD